MQSPILSCNIMCAWGTLHLLCSSRSAKDWKMHLALLVIAPWLKCSNCAINVFKVQEICTAAVQWGAAPNNDTTGQRTGEWFKELQIITQQQRLVFEQSALPRKSLSRVSRVVRSAGWAWIKCPTQASDAKGGGGGSTLLSSSSLSSSSSPPSSSSAVSSAFS